MFTGIIESQGLVKCIRRSGTNIHFEIESNISEALKIDQSVSHNGVCLTVVQLASGTHEVTAIEETLQKTNLGALKEGQKLNLERCTQIGARLDGHIVQGHIDTTTTCKGIESRDGSWHFEFPIPKGFEHLLIQQGSICINGVSLTVARLEEESFTVAIIPYTYEHTTFCDMKVDDAVNLEFDVIGKYITRMKSLNMV